MAETFLNQHGSKNVKKGKRRNKRMHVRVKKCKKGKKVSYNEVVGGTDSKKRRDIVIFTVAVFRLT